MQRLIVNVFFTQDFDQGVAHQFAGAQLALRWSQLHRRSSVGFIFKRVPFHPVHIGVSADFSIQKYLRCVMQVKTIL
jgi:hypothetical protein